MVRGLNTSRWLSATNTLSLFSGSFFLSLCLSVSFSLCLSVSFSFSVHTPSHTHSFSHYMQTLSLFLSFSFFLSHTLSIPKPLDRHTSLCAEGIYYLSQQTPLHCKTNLACARASIIFVDRSRSLAIFFFSNLMQCWFSSNFSSCRSFIGGGMIDVRFLEMVIVKLVEKGQHLI